MTLDMYAITFFKLIENSLKLDGEDYRILANIYSLPHLNPTQSRNIIKMLDTYGEATKPITSDKIKNDRERLRKILAGNSPV
jgi:hypothetical protein